VALKSRRKRGERDATLVGRTLVLIFEKASTRTRLSFEAAIGQLGGQAITLSTSDSQLARGESWSDTAKVISGYADAVMIRTFADARLQEFAKASRVPVINGWGTAPATWRVRGSRRPGCSPSTCGSAPPPATARPRPTCTSAPSWWRRRRKRWRART
jgi:hypothetical protein